MILCVLTPLCTVFQLFYMANFDAQAEIGMAFAFPNTPIIQFFIWIFNLNQAMKKDVRHVDCHQQPILC